MDPREGPRIIIQAPYNTPHNVASTPRSLVQGAEQKQHHPLQKRPLANRMCEESIETITMNKRRLLWSGALLRMSDHRLYPTASFRESWRTQVNMGRGGGERMDGLRGRGSSAI